MKGGKPWGKRLHSHSPLCDRQKEVSFLLVMTQFCCFKMHRDFTLSFQTRAKKLRGPASEPEVVRRVDNRDTEEVALGRVQVFMDLGATPAQEESQCHLSNTSLSRWLQEAAVPFSKAWDARLKEAAGLSLY